MPKLIILGSAHAIPDLAHENTHLALVGSESLVIIDLPNNPLVRLKRAGLDVNQLTDLIVTHFHPDHVSGVPILLMNLWLMGRKEPLSIHGLTSTMYCLQSMMELYEWQTWQGFYPLFINQLPAEEIFPVAFNSEWRIFSSPVKHLIPTLGLRIEFIKSKKVMAFSSDTEPCPEMVNLAKQADVLLHEATGKFTGHSNPAQAGEVATQASAKSLYLIHYPTREKTKASLVTEAQQTFSGQVKLAEDLMVLDF